MVNKKDDDDILSEHLSADGDIDSIINDRTTSAKFKELVKSWQEPTSLVETDSAAEVAKAEIIESARAAEATSPSESTLPEDETSDSSKSSDASSVDESDDSQPDSSEDRPEPKPVYSEKDRLHNKEALVSDPEFSREILAGKVAPNYVPVVRVVSHPMGAYVIKGVRSEEETFTDLYANRVKLDDPVAIAEQINKLEALMAEQRRASLRTKAEIIQSEHDLDESLRKAPRDVKDRVIVLRSKGKAAQKQGEKRETTPANKPLTKAVQATIDLLFDNPKMTKQVLLDKLVKAGKMTAAAKDYIDKLYA